MSLLVRDLAKSRAPLFTYLARSANLPEGLYILIFIFSVTVTVRLKVRVRVSCRIRIRFNNYNMSRKSRTASYLAIRHKFGVTPVGYVLAKVIWTCRYDTAAIID